MAVTRVQGGAAVCSDDDVRNRLSVTSEDFFFIIQAYYEGSATRKTENLISTHLKPVHILLFLAPRRNRLPSMSIVAKYQYQR